MIQQSVRQSCGRVRTLHDRKGVGWGGLRNTQREGQYINERSAQQETAVYCSRRNFGTGLISDQRIKIGVDPKFVLIRSFTRGIEAGGEAG